MRKLLSLLAGIALTAVAQAQACSSLTITGDGAPGTDLAFAIHGDANSLALLAIGETVGASSLHFGRLGTLDLGLDRPFILLPIGRTDANGDLQLTFTVPSQVTRGIDLQGQSTTVTFTFRPLSLSFCTSDVVAFHVGT